MIPQMRNLHSGGTDFHSPKLEAETVNAVSTR